MTTAHTAPPLLAVTAVTPLCSPLTSVGTKRGRVVPSPTEPQLFVPQHFNAPPAMMTQRALPPITTATTPELKPETSTGVLRTVVALSPTRASQHLSAPPVKIAQPPLLPIAIFVTPADRPVTSTGTF